MIWNSEILNHLWQSTAFAVAVALACRALRRNSPRLRYWLWLAASMKFLLPFSLLVSTGARVQMPPDTPSLHAVTVQQISMAFAPALPVHTRFHWEWIAVAIWPVGALFLLVRWLRNWRETKTAVLEPGVFGIFHPVLVLPKGLAYLLTEEQLQAVLAHEARHIECYDNLTAALHMIVETIFWFHPLVWWIGARLMDERERDCDEAVLRQGSQPGVYARSIVQVCETYVESPLACASGISGSDLKKRIREIMTWRGSLPITLRAKATLAVAAIAAVSIPFVIGVLRAQTLPPAPAYGYEVASIHKSAPGDGNHSIEEGPRGGWRARNISAVGLIAAAYNVQPYQVVGATGWATSENYDIVFTPDEREAALQADAGLKEIQASMGRNAQRLQAVLRDRFSLVLRTENRDLPIYNLVQSKGGARLPAHDPAMRGPEIRSNGRQITGSSVTVAMLAQQLSLLLDRPVHDETGLTGEYDFKVDWAPDSDASGTGPSIFTALTEQLGLRLESAKGPVQVYVIEKVEQPSEN
jgi:bla regulator protein blaR1